LYNAALDLAELNADETALDLYCGTGTITLLLAQRAGLAIGAEIVAPAIADAEENARRNGVPNARFLCADAANAAAQLAAEGLHPDVVTVDPPRKGLAPAVVETIAQMAPKRVVYVSCDPATLARDVARLAAQGYRLSRALAVDMFPRCAHVESVVKLIHAKE
jgi:23S rRNA (uracil1939-C5)-methyltransferase